MTNNNNKSQVKTTAAKFTPRVVAAIKHMQTLNYFVFVFLKTVFMI